jgi:ribosomal protein S27AE
MELRTRSRRLTSVPRFSNTCAQCGDALFMPEWSEYVSERQVRHLWVCDSCGYRFETIVGFSEP